jgi:hypothetical protein
VKAQHPLPVQVLPRKQALPSAQLPVLLDE